MRVSANPSDPGYANFDPRFHYDVTLDGMGMNPSAVVTADEEEGFVYLAEMPLRVVGDEIAMKMLFGKVVIDKALKGI